MRSTSFINSTVYERMMLMHNCLFINAAKDKNIVTLVSSCSKVLIEPYKINHSIDYFSYLFKA